MSQLFDTSPIEDEDGKKKKKGRKKQPEPQHASTYRREPDVEVAQHG